MDAALVANWQFSAAPTMLRTIICTARLVARQQSRLFLFRAVSASKHVSTSYPAVSAHPSNYLLFQMKSMLSKGKASEAANAFAAAQQHGELFDLQCSEQYLLALSKLRQVDEMVRFMTTHRDDVLSLHHYNIVINALCASGRIRQADEFLGQLRAVGLEPDTSTYNSFLHGYVLKNDIETAQRLFLQMIESGVGPTDVTVGTLLKGWAQRKDAMNAMALLHNMKKKFLIRVNLTMYNTVLNIFCTEGDMKGAQQILMDMRSDKISPDAITFRTVLKGWINANDVQKAREWFDSADKLLINPSLDDYTILLSALCQVDMKQGLEFYDKMQKQGLIADEHTYVALLKGWCEQRNIDEAEKLFKTIPHPTIRHFTVLAMAYVSCGQPQKCLLLLELLRAHGVVPDVQFWANIVRGFAQLGDTIHVEKFLREISQQGLQLGPQHYHRLFCALRKANKSHTVLKIGSELEANGFPFDQLLMNEVLFSFVDTKNFRDAHKYGQKMREMGFRPGWRKSSFGK